MKKILIAALLLGWMAVPASAQGVKKMKQKGNCPAATCTDHSLDNAYSPEWNKALKMPSSEEVTATTPAQRKNTWTQPVNGPYYNLKNYTVYGHAPTGISRPSAYYGDDAPTYDGAQKNAYRNMRVNNTSQPLPGNNGSK
jgi:hypothetical protein